MNAGLEPYPAYRDSGTAWLGEIPAHWSARQLGRFGGLFKGNGGTKGDEIPDGVPCIRYGDIYTQHQFFTEASRSCVSAERANDYTPIRYGDILFTGSGETIEEIGKSVACLIRSRACCGGDVIVFRPSIEVDARFMGYATDCRAAASQKSRMGRGITVIHLYGDQLKYMWIALPPLIEQATIAHYLDRETARIDALVAKKRRLIELLQEKRTALISHAVTKGLDPDAPMKDSGLEWLGLVPAAWAVAPVYSRYEVQLGKMLDTSKISGDHLRPFVRNVDVQWDGINMDDLPMMDFDSSDRARFALKPGDLLVCEGGEVGKAALWTGDMECYYQKALHRLRPRRIGEFPRFVYYVLLTAAKRGVFVAGSNQNTIDHLTAEKLRRHRFAFPEPAAQRGIAEYLDRETQRVDRLIGRVREAVDRIKEYRSALITAAVTGQIDVRTYRQEAS